MLVPLAEIVDMCPADVFVPVLKFVDATRLRFIGPMLFAKVTGTV